MNKYEVTVSGWGEANAEEAELFELELAGDYAY
jgi:hypothetical protein